MHNKRLLLHLLTFAICLTGAYFALRQAGIKWEVLVRTIGDFNGLRLGASLALIYAAFAVRALRWQGLVIPEGRLSFSATYQVTLLGFFLVAIAGRIAELARPALFARKSHSSMSLQAGALITERLLDVFCVLTVGLLGFLVTVRHTPALSQFVHTRNLILLVTVLVVAAGGVFWLHHRRSGALKETGVILRVIHDIQLGLTGILKTGRIAPVVLMTFLMWSLIIGAYCVIIFGMPQPLGGLSLWNVAFLVAVGATGAVLHLPGGFGQQFVIVAVLRHVFSAPNELAVSCAALIWLATFMAPVPTGLVLLYREGIGYDIATSPPS